MTPLARWAYALFFMAISACSQADNSPHKWTEFETVAGQPYPVPKHWLATPNGRLTHNIVLPGAMPKPVPFDFTQAKLRALLPFTPSVSEQYWRHLCATEAGQYIFKTAKPVEGLAFMRISTVPFKNEDEADFDAWLYEAGFLEIFIGQHNPPEYIASPFIGWPFSTYRHVEVPDATGSTWMRFSRVVDEPAYAPATELASTGKWLSNRLESPTEKYALTWRGLVRPQDREHRIAGFELIVLDRQSGEVLSVLRNFQQSLRSWRSDKGCDEIYSSYASPGDMPGVLLALRTLQTGQISTWLKSNDERVSRRVARP